MEFKYAMPLPDPRREKFCQEVAWGMPFARAYVAAGYAQNPGNCLRMYKKPAIVARIQEIKQERVAIYNKAFEKAVDKIALEKADIVRMLLEDRQKAQGAKQYSVSVKCLELIGKMIGAFEEGSKDKSAPLDGLSGDRLKQILDAIDGQREGSVKDPDQREAANGTQSNALSGQGDLSEGIVPPTYEVH